jgi:hypothetical protein
MNATKQKKKEKRKNVQFPKTICYFVIFTTFHSFSVKRNEKSVFCCKTSKHQNIHLFLEVEVNGGDWCEE